MVNFSDTEHYKWLALSRCYFLAAGVLVDSAAFTNGRALFLPTLQLTAHGIELFLKGNLIGSGMSSDEVKTRFGHELMLLWRAPNNSEIRHEIMNIANEVRLDARGADKWNSRFRPVEENFEEYMERLALLHGRDTDYALRYPSDDRLEGPSVPFLVETFDRASRLALGQPERLLPR